MGVGVSVSVGVGVSEFVGVSVNVGVDVGAGTGTQLVIVATNKIMAAFNRIFLFFILFSAVTGLPGNLLGWL